MLACINTLMVSNHRWKWCSAAVNNRLWSCPALYVMMDDQLVKGFHLQLVVSTSRGGKTAWVLVRLLCPSWHIRPGGHTVPLPVWLWRSVKRCSQHTYGLQRLIHFLLWNNSFAWVVSFLLRFSCPQLVWTGSGPLLTLLSLVYVAYVKV